MIRIEIPLSLRNEIFRTFKKESLKVYSLIKQLKRTPNKGKVLGHVGNNSIRELKYKSFRFYYIINGPKLILFNSGKLSELLIRFIKMSKKNNQQKTINDIKQILKFIDFEKEQKEQK